MLSCISKTLLALLAVSVPFAAVVSAAPPTFATRDMKVVRDINANINANVNANVNLGLGTDDLCIFAHTRDLALLNGLIDLDLGANICLCIGGIPDLLHLNADIAAAVNLLGAATVSAFLHVIIQSGPHRQCHFPPKSVRACINDDPCSFTCTDGFVKQGNQCVCPSPLCIENGKCVVPSH